MYCESMNEKVYEYESFLNETLRQNLQNVLDKRDTVYRQVSEHLQLKTLIEKLKEGGAYQTELKTKVDLGCNFYVQANIPDASKIFVSIGLGVFIEFTYDEALQFIDKKTTLLYEQIDILTKSASRVKAHMKLVLEALKEIQNIKDEMDSPHRDLFS